MSQPSLLSSCAPPDSQAKLEGWVIRVRDRLRSISKNVSHLEAERQSLLSMLWGAGLRDFAVEELDSIPVHAADCHAETEGHVFVPESVRVSQTSARSIIDLVSDEEPDSRASHSSADRPTPVECPPTPRVALDQEQDENMDIGNLDPRELSFELPKVLPLEPPKQRVYKPEEWLLIDWEKMSVGELKKWLYEFGMKPSGGRGHMVCQLKLIFEYITSDGAQVTSLPRAFTKQDLFAEFSALIRDHHVLYEKIILFESVELADVVEFLLSKRREEWPSVTQWTVREFLETIGAQFSNTTGNASANGRIRIHASDAREEAPRKKVRRHLRKSMSCP